MSTKSSRAHKFTYKPTHKTNGVTDVRVKKKVIHKNDNGDWEYNDLQRGREQINEQLEKKNCPKGTFDHKLIPLMMNPIKSTIEILYEKHLNGEKLSKSDIIRVENYLSKKEKLVEIDIKKLSTQGLNAPVETEEGRIIKLFMVAEKFIDKDDNEMVYYVYQRLSEFDIPDSIMKKYHKVMKDILHRITLVDRVSLQFTKFHANMPPLNQKGFVALDPWQKEVIGLIDENKSILVQVPTSGGKSIMSGYVFLKENIKALVVVPTDILAWQMASMIGDIVSKDIPIVTKTFKSIPRRDELIQLIQTVGIVVGTPDTIFDLLPFINIDFNWVILDEIHMINDDGCCEMENIARAFSHVPTLALSATIGNAEELCEWFNRIGNDMSIVKCTKRFINFQRFYYEPDNCEFKRIHPLSMVSIENFSDGSIVDMTLNCTPPDVWDLAIKLSKKFDLGNLVPTNYFAQDHRITLDESHQYNSMLIQFMVDKYGTDKSLIQSILDQLRSTMWISFIYAPGWYKANLRILVV